MVSRPEVACSVPRWLKLGSQLLFYTPYCGLRFSFGCYRIVANVYLSSVCPILLFRLPIIWFTDFAALWSFPLASFVTSSLWSCGLSRAGVQKLRELLPVCVFPVFFLFCFFCHCHFRMFSPEENSANAFGHNIPLNNLASIGSLSASFITLARQSELGSFSVWFMRPLRISPQEPPLSSLRGDPTRPLLFSVLFPGWGLYDGLLVRALCFKPWPPAIRRDVCGALLAFCASFSPVI